LSELNSNSAYQEANQPRSFLVQVAKSSLDGSSKEASWLLPLPQDGQSIPYSDLIARSQYQIDAASEAFLQRKWKELKATAQNLKETAERFESAIKVPDDTKEGLAAWAEKLADGAVLLVEAAESERVGKTEKALAEIKSLLGDKGMQTTYIRIREPLILSALLSRAIGETQGRYTVSTWSPMEAFMAYLKVALMCGLVLGSPWIFYQLWSFVAAGLYPHEKRLVNVYLP